VSPTAEKVAESIDELAAGWEVRQIQEVAEVNPRVDKKAIPDDIEISFVPMPAVEAESGQINVSQTKIAKEVKKGFTAFLQGDVLFAKITPCMENGKMAIAPALTNGYGFGSTEFHVLRPGEGIDAKYLYYYVSGKSFRGEAARFMTGAVGQKRVSTTYIKEATIPVAPLEDQRRIVAEIEKQFSRLDEAVASLKRVKANVKRYKAAALKAAVEGKLTEEWRKQSPDVEPASKLLERILAERRTKWEEAELAKMKARGKVGSGKGKKYKEPVATDASALAHLPDGWQWISADSVSILITDGKHGDCKDADGSGYFFLSAKDVKGGKLVYEGSREIDQQEFAEVHQRTNLELGDVLITNAGTIGRIAVATDSDRVARTTFQKSVAVIKPLRDFILSEYLALFLEAHVQQMKAKSAGTAVKNLLLRDLRAASVALPPVLEQIRLVMEVGSLLSVSDELECEVEKSLIRAARLRQAILARGFSGGC